MLIRSTGLGRTLLTCSVTKIEATTMVPETLEDSKDDQEQPTRLLMVVQTTDPVSWTIRAFVEPEDLREVVRVALKPSVLLTTLKFLLFGGRSAKKKAAPALAAGADRTAAGQTEA